jgi:HlyD family secretion protein
MAYLRIFTYKQNMKNRFVIILLVLTVSCTGSSNEIKPRVKPLIEAVYASGYVVALDQYNVFSQAEGYVAEKVVQDGANVRKGDPIYIIESGQQSSRFDLARKNFALAQSNYSNGSPVLNEAAAAMRLSESKLQHDSINFERFENLLKRNATTRAEYDRMRLAYQSSKNEYILQQSRLRRVKDQLYLEFQNAKSQLAIAGDESGKYIVRSEIDGKVFKVLKEKSELVRRGESVAIIGDSSKYYLQLSIDELDVQRVKAGQEILITIDAFPDKIFRGRVQKIYPMVNQQLQSVRADAILLDVLPGFYSGLAVEANIIIRRNQKALVVPRKALEGKDTLQIKSDGGVKAVRVKTGIQTLEEIEILEGIDSNTTVVY